MVDTVRIDRVLALARLIDDHKGIETIVIDIAEQSSWTDYFVITTVSSQAHLRGLVRNIRKYLAENGIEPFHKHKNLTDDGWTLIDCGDFVVHLMNKELREFYDLEKLWFSGRVLNHSSKSS